MWILQSSNEDLAVLLLPSQYAAMAPTKQPSWVLLWPAPYTQEYKLSPQQWWKCFLLVQSPEPTPLRGRGGLGWRRGWGAEHQQGALNPSLLCSCSCGHRYLTQPHLSNSCCHLGLHSLLLGDMMALPCARSHAEVAAQWTVPAEKHPCMYVSITHTCVCTNRFVCRQVSLQTSWVQKLRACTYWRRSRELR